MPSLVQRVRTATHDHAHALDHAQAASDMFHGTGGSAPVEAALSRLQSRFDAKRRGTRLTIFTVHLALSAEADLRFPWLRD